MYAEKVTFQLKSHLFGPFFCVCCSLHMYSEVAAEPPLHSCLLRMLIAKSASDSMTGILKDSVYAEKVTFQLKSHLFGPFVLFLNTCSLK